MSRRNARHLILFLLLAFTLGISPKGCAASDVQSTLRHIPSKDRFYMTYFFKELVCSDGLGYTLFGDKPVCISGYLSSPSSFIQPTSACFKKGWGLWKKYEHLFPHPQFLFIEESVERTDLQEFEQCTGEKIDFRSIYIINTHEFLKKCYEQQALFQQVLGDDFNPENLLLQMAHKQAFFPLIHCHEGLLGILLGYGVESSMRYHQMQQENPHFYNQRNPIEPIHPLSFGKIRSIQFVGDPHSPEVQEILQRNWFQQRQICQRYAAGDFLETTLKRLVSTP